LQVSEKKPESRVTSATRRGIVSVGK